MQNKFIFIIILFFGFVNSNELSPFDILPTSDPLTQESRVCLEKLNENAKDAIIKCNNESRAKWSVRLDDTDPLVPLYGTNQQICCSAWDTVDCVVEKSKSYCSNDEIKALQLWATWNGNKTILFKKTIQRQGDRNDAWVDVCEQKYLYHSSHCRLGLAGWHIALITIACVLVVGLLIGAVIYIILRRTRRIG